MKLFSREFDAHYQTYRFGYCNYAEREAGDKVADIYALGYLPYSGSADVHNTFYMARSVRTDLAAYSPNSENRRVLKKFDGSITGTLTPIANFDVNDAAFTAFCLDYFTRQHGPDVMPHWRLQHILNAGIVTHIMRYTDADGDVAGYVFLLHENGITHYWFSFYAEHMNNTSFGMYMMLDCTRVATTAGHAHHYLGTAYGEGGRYKLNFPALEYWAGNAWNNDAAQLKSLLTDDLKKQSQTPLRSVA